MRAGRFIKGFGYAWKGIVHAVGMQFNLRFHLAAAVVAIGMGFWLGISGTEWCFIIFAIGLVISAEMFNTAIEMLVDLASPAWNEKAGRIKDIAAGAVLICAITALVIGMVVFLPKLIEWFF